MNRKKGFTLLEILIAIGILALGLVTVFSLFPVGIYAVKETVDDTRSASLAATARADMAAIRANLRILDSGSQTYGGYVPMGPWRFPGQLNVFRAPLYEYADAGGNPVKRVVFDDRKWVPVRLFGSFTTGSTTVTIRQADLNRDSDRLEYLYDSTNPGPNMYVPYEIYVRVRGQEYRIIDRTYSAVLPGGNLATLILEGPPASTPNFTAANVEFQVLLPVAQKEPPMDVPQEWVGGIADFTVGEPTYNIEPLSQNRNLAQYLCWPNGWISVRGDWFRLTNGTLTGGMPDSITLDSDANHPQPTDVFVDLIPPLTLSPPFTDTEDFKLLLPVVTFDQTPNYDDNGTLADESDDSLILPVLGALPPEAGGGPQLGFVESGAYIEVMLDGAWGAFSTANVNKVDIVAGTLNTDYSAFIAAGNFIRVEGRDYEISDATNMPASFDIVGAVPNLGDRYFNIVLGYQAGVEEVHGVARFPVRSVSPRQPPGFPVTEFTIGADPRGKLATDLSGLGGASAISNPVHILPKNNSQFAYEVVLAEKSLSGAFTNLSSEVDGPSWPAATPDSPVMAIIPFPPSLDPAAMNSGVEPYSIQLLTAPDSAGTRYTSAITSVDLSYAFLTVSNTACPTGTLPFHAFDANDIVADVVAGTGQYTAATLTVDFTAGSITPDAIFLAPGINVFALDGLGNSISTTVASVGTDIRNVTLAAGGLTDGQPATITINASAPGARNRPSGRGAFTQGSDVVMAVYADELTDGAGTPLAGTQPEKGFPFSATTPARHELAVGDYIRIENPGELSYAVKAINDTTLGTASSRYDFLVLDRPYEGATNADAFFRYVTPIEEVYGAQVAVFRNYRITALKDAAGTRAQAAAFGFDAAGALDRMLVQLRVPLPPNFKPGDFIRADGDADHSSAPSSDFGLSDALDGDWYWYMIDRISANRQGITLTSPYRGYIPSTMTYQPASATNGIVRTFDTAVGAF